MPVSYRRFNACVSAESILNEGTDEELECQGYRKTTIGNILYYTSIIFTFGFILFIFKWKPVWAVKFRKRKFSLSGADEVIVKDKCGQKCVISIIDQQVSRSFPADYSYSRTTLANYAGELAEPITISSQLIGNEGLFFKYFVHRHIKYYWDRKTARFKKLRGYDYKTSCADLLEKFSGLTPEQQQTKLLLFGENSIEVEVKSYFKLFTEEILHPFYVFQIFSIILWFVDNYVYFSACILIITTVSMLISLYEIRKQSQSLHDMVATSGSSTVCVLRRDKAIEEISSNCLVPGDIVLIPQHGCTMLCDAVLITGSCIVNESMLTGESVPVTKTQLPHQDDVELYSPDQHKRHTLFCGTRVIQTRYYGENQVKAVVIRTGFSTAKGELVRSILFPRPMGFKFYRDSMRFIFVLFLIALMGIGYSLHVYIKAHYPLKKIIIRMLDIVTIVVPPTLPAAMTVGSIYAQNRLKKQKIFCISPPRINICGKIKLVCFDKTGTLTEDGLDLSGVVPVEKQNFVDMISDPSQLSKKSPIIVAMATCHSLTRIEGELRGDPLDLKMFQATKWSIDEPGDDITRYDLLCPMVVHPPYMTLVTSQDYMCGREKAPFEVGIIRQFTFSSDLQRMSVIARVLEQPQMNLYTKGAPEKILTLCLPETVPGDFNQRLETYTLRGYRVIALAWKMLDVKLTWLQAQKIKRNEVEQNLTFLGLIVMQNTLKPETSAVIKSLIEARVRTIMATGDNMHTAISVARECGMVPPVAKVIIINAHPPEGAREGYLKMEIAERGEVHGEINGDISIAVEGLIGQQYHFCVNGRSFSTIRRYFPQYLPMIVVKGTIFARMSPDQKSQLVKELQEVGYLVGMCGDGANDCGALKAADVGISLSEAEASVAAPFTSRIPNIQCVPITMKEGRCALVTSFGVFKYMALYSMIQFISVLILYTLATNLGDQQFLYIDLCLATVMAVVMSYTQPYNHLVAERPAGSLVNLSVIFSILCQILICAAMQICAIIILKQQFWYIPNKPDSQDDFKTCWEATVIFSVSTFQYVILAAVFASGPPFRKPFYSNVWLVFSLICFTALNILFTLAPFDWIADFFQLNKNARFDQFVFRLWLLALPAINLCLSLAVERFANSNTLTKLSRVIKRKTKPKNRYRQLENDISLSSECLFSSGILDSDAALCRR